MDAKHWTGDDERDEGGYGLPYVCRDCPWTGRGGALAFEHHSTTGHAIRGRQWPADWPDAVFRCCAEGLPHTRTA